jgi:predicted nucleic acid-binding protein
MSRLVLDSSVVIAAGQPAETHHADALAFVDRLRVACAAGAASLFAPPELWLEVHVVEHRLARPPRESALASLAVELVAPADREAITRFLDRLTARTRGRKPFANATDLVYLWAAFEVGAVLVTLDQGLLQYDHAVCEVRRPQDCWFR